MSVKISELEIENVKRVKALHLEPTENGLTVIGGGNGQGKTSVLDTIAWALGGDKYRPTNPTREGSYVPPSIHVTLTNGVIVERTGKNSSLKVIDPTNKKGGQALLNSFVEAFALDLPKFMNSSSKDKTKTLLQIIGVEKELTELEIKEAELYNERQVLGREVTKKKALAEELPIFPDAPAEPVSISDLIAEQQEILARNGKNQLARNNLEELNHRHDAINDKINIVKARLEDLRRRIDDSLKELEELNHAAEDITEQEEAAYKTVSQLKDESTAEIEEKIANFEDINAKVRANLDRSKAEMEAISAQAEYDILTDKIKQVREDKLALLAGANLPLPGLSVDGGDLTYNGMHWDGMSGAEQLRVSAAIVKAIKPQCGFVLVDKLEQLDLETLRDFAAWTEQEGLQIIGTRVSTGDECSIIIEDGESRKTADTWVRPEAKQPEPAAPAWTPGTF